MAERKLTLADTDEVVVRMYGQGFGDCFLLAFPRQAADGTWDRANPVYVVIDCGVFYQTPQGKQRMEAVTRSVQTATGGKVDLLVITHEHHDHLCGFEYAREDWQKIQVENIWVAWTENEKHSAFKQYDEERQVLELHTRDVQKVIEQQRDAGESPMRELNHLLGLLEFAVGGPLEESDERSRLPDKVLSDIVSHPEKRFKIGQGGVTIACCEPAEVRAVPGSAVDAYVLGPPTDLALLGMALDESEVYPNEQQEATIRGGTASQGQEVRALPPDEGSRISAAVTRYAPIRAERLGIGAAIERYIKLRAGTPIVDEYAPFARSEQVDWKDAEADQFFRTRYFEPEPPDPKRRIDWEWLRGVSRLALQLDDLTNNTSLVLAFRLPSNRYLLFVGDAQVGNWLSWRKINPSDWKRPDNQGGVISPRPTIDEILGNTAVYKVGHHGSHNATLKQNGLEKMPDDLVAFVPVAEKFPQEVKKWKIPLDSLIRRLQEKTSGQVVLPYDSAYTSAAFQARWDPCEDVLEAMTRQKDDGTTTTFGGAVPLWRQVRIPAQ